MNPEANKDTPLVYNYPDTSAKEYVATSLNPEVEVDFSALTETAKSTAKAWELEGFKTTHGYVDLHGDLILVASQAIDNLQIHRLMTDGNVIDIPPAFHGNDLHVDLISDGKRLYHNRQNIYDTGGANSQADVPLELWAVIEKFGDRLYEDEVEPGKWLLHNGNPHEALGYGLDVMEQEVDERKEAAAEFTKQRGRLTHQRAREAMDLVPLPRLRTLKSMARYNEKRREAYRRELEYQNSLDDDDFR